MNRRCGLRDLTFGAGLGILILLSALPATASDCLRISYPDERRSFVIGIRDHFKGAMKEAGICIDLVPVPRRREIVMLRNGELDGTLVRVPAFKKVIGDAAIMLSVPLGEASGDLVTRDPSFTSLTNLAGRRIGVVLGARWNTELVQGLPQTNVYPVRTESQLFDMLRLGRLEGILITSLQLDELKKTFNGALTVTHLVTLSGYTWITPANRDRIPALEAAIRAYLASGRKFVDQKD